MRAPKNLWRLDFREDQVRFLVAALEHVNVLCDGQASSAPADYLTRKFTAERTKERSSEIITYIEQVTK